MKVAILGFGKQGRSAYEYWKNGNEVTICDQDENLDLPSDVQKQLGPEHLKNLDQFDLIVRSPIVHPADIVAANSAEIYKKVTSVTNEFFRVSPSKNIIGVTGTKGKGTTSTLIVKMLEAEGKKVHLGGNIGKPPLDMLKASIQTDDWVILELANFQLIDLRYSPSVAVCLMVVEEHLDWHADVNEYITAKQQLFIHQNVDDFAIYFAQNQYSTHIASVSKGHKIPYMHTPGADVIENKVVIEGHTICDISEIKLLGKHNWQNVCAAVTAVWQLSPNPDALRKAITEFSGLPNRLELVRTFEDVDYYNDSFSSGPEATIAAIDAIPKQKVIIIGGFERGLNLQNLAEQIKNSSSVHKVLLIGASAKRVSESLVKSGFTAYQLSTSRTMSEIVKEARDLAITGGAVVLSPGFASLDMFKNFEERGNQFREAVNKL